MAAVGDDEYYNDLVEQLLSVHGLKNGSGSGATSQAVLAPAYTPSSWTVASNGSVTIGKAEASKLYRLKKKQELQDLQQMVALKQQQLEQLKTERCLLSSKARVLEVMVQHYGTEAMHILAALEQGRASSSSSGSSSISGSYSSSDTDVRKAATDPAHPAVSGQLAPAEQPDPLPHHDLQRQVGAATPSGSTPEAAAPSHPAPTSHLLWSMKVTPTNATLTADMLSFRSTYRGHMRELLPLMRDIEACRATGPPATSMLEDMAAEVAAAVAGPGLEGDGHDAAAVAAAAEERVNLLMPLLFKEISAFGARHEMCFQYLENLNMETGEQVEQPLWDMLQGLAGKLKSRLTPQQLLDLGTALQLHEAKVAQNQQQRILLSKLLEQQYSQEGGGGKARFALGRYQFRGVHVAEIAAAMSAELRRELAASSCLMRAFAAIIGNLIMADAFVMAYPYLPNLPLLVPLLLEGQLVGPVGNKA